MGSGGGTTYAVNSLGPTTEPITGQLIDQHGDPVDNATILSHSITEPALDKSDARTLERQAEDLRDELTDPMPSSWDPDYDLESHYQDNNGNYLLVHEQDDWGTTSQAVFDPNSPLGAPNLQVDSDQQVVLSLWDPSKNGDWFENQIDGAYPGATTGGTIVIEQKGPTGETIDSMDKETTVIAETTGGRVRGTNKHQGVRTSLPTGVYVAYPEGARERGYTFVVGSPDELASAWESDLRDEANQLTERASRIRDLLGKDHVAQNAVKTNETGHFTVYVPSNAVTTDLKGMKIDGQTLETADNPSLENLREAQAGGYNGTFYLPSPEANTVEPPAKGVEVTVYRSPKVPMGDMSSFAELMQFLENQRLNETISDLESEYNERFEEMERQKLERVYQSHRTLVETVPDADERYLNRSDFEEIQDAEDLTDAQLPNETEHMQVALAATSNVEPVSEEDIIEFVDDSDELNLDSENITEADSYLRTEYALPDSVDPDTVAPEIHWTDGTTEPIPEKYWSVDSGGILDRGGQTLTIEGFPIQSSDPAAFDIRVQAASSGSTGVGPIGGDDGGVLDDRVSATNPAFNGEMPALDAVQFSTHAPGPSERVYVGLDAASESGYEKLTDVTVYDDDGKPINATIDESRDRASFTTNGDGVHQIRLTFESNTGDQFVISERIRALEQSRSDPATIRAGEAAGTGTYAIVGESLESARIDTGQTLEIDAIADSSTGPSELNVHPGSALEGAETIDVSVLHGSDESRVNSNVQVNIHLEDHPEDALHWRNGQAFAADGSDRFGQVTRPNEDKAIIRTYTDETGQVSVRVNQDPNALDRLNHRVSRTLAGLPNPLAVVGGGSLFTLALGFVAKRRFFPR